MRFKFGSTPFRALLACLSFLAVMPVAHAHGIAWDRQQLRAHAKLAPPVQTIRPQAPESESRGQGSSVEDSRQGGTPPIALVRAASARVAFGTVSVRKARAAHASKESQAVALAWSVGVFRFGYSYRDPRVSLSIRNRGPSAPVLA